MVEQDFFLILQKKRMFIKLKLIYRVTKQQSCDGDKAAKFDFFFPFLLRTFIKVP